MRLRLLFLFTLATETQKHSLSAYGGRTTALLWFSVIPAMAGIGASVAIILITLLPLTIKQRSSEAETS